MAVHFMGNPAITIIITYAATEDKSDVEKDMFYDDLQRYTHDVPSHNVLILAGDLNARLGSDSHTTNPRTIGKYTYHHSTDDNGNGLANYCEACNMRSTQTRFPQPQSRSWAWLHPNGKSKAQLDHILINGKWLNSIRNVRAYNTVELNSDHRIVSAQLSISLRATKENKQENQVTSDTVNILEQRNKAKVKFKHNPSIKNKNQWHTLNQQLDTSYNNDKIKFLEDKLEQLEQAALSNQIRATWCLVDEISGKRRHNSASQIKRADGTKINSTAELMSEWKNYFEDLLNVKSNNSQDTQAIPPALEDLPINQGLITLEEVEQAVKQLKDGKSPGLDYAITPEVLKYGGQWILNQLCNICNEIYENQQTPKQFNTNIIIRIPKKGDKTLTTNYRGISLMSVAAKTYNRILLNRIREPLDSILRINQADNNVSEEFDVTTGVLQGDTLAPFLFIIVIDYVMKNAQLDHTDENAEYGFITNKRQSSRQPAATIHDLDFADDIALLENSLERAQSQLIQTTKRASEVGLQINIKKTKVLTNQNTINQSIQLNGQDIEWTNNFKYLGSMVLDSNTDIKVRKGQAWKAFWRMKNMWKSTTIPIQLKTNIYKASCLSIFLFGCESWTITNKLEKVLNSFATSCYRIMLGIKRLDKVSNNTIYGIVKQEPMVQRVQRRQLRFIGHCLRKNSNEFINQYALYIPRPGHGKRKRGRPRLNYPDYVARLINNDEPPTITEIRKTAANRKEWHKIVVACRPPLFAAE
ncbi:unnamed protein product [Adineta ricciae]|uniref:Reverse transcriptase domain-containing protein n=1 Tax=Adineta ricciae TaxID=249248 RepID=A0A815BYN5_ADIRI|nr:unnamed protein product [Adineta ricciae]